MKQKILIEEDVNQCAQLAKQISKQASMKERRKKEEVFLVFPSNPMSYWINAKKKKNDY